MNERLVAYATPFFFLLIGVELLVARLERRRLYRFSDSINDLSCGVGQQMMLPFLKFISLAIYGAVFEHLRLFTVSPASALGWVAVFFGVDCGYYWFHRASHRVNVYWALHVVHHQSEEYNLSVALRQSWGEEAVYWIFYLPLAVLGFPPEMFFVMSTLNTLYQFWIHTRAVKKLGPLEWVLNTPSHHRVHHGSNPKYIDKNYAGVLIIWDRLFGTFQEEEEEPVYGTVKPLASFNPLWANVHYWVEMASLARLCPKAWQKAWVWLAPPEWRPKELGGDVTIPEVTREAQKKYDPVVPRGVAAYAGVQFVVVGAVTTAMSMIQSSPRPLSMPEVAAVTAVVLTNLVVWGALFEGKRWAVPLELLRLAAAPAVVGWIASARGVLVPAALLAATLSMFFAAWVVRYRGAASPSPAETTAAPT